MEVGIEFITIAGLPRHRGKQGIWIFIFADSDRKSTKNLPLTRWIFRKIKECLVVCFCDLFDYCSKFLSW